MRTGLYDSFRASTVLKEGGFWLFFFSREETRMHVHVNHADGEAKFWLEPAIVLAQNFELSPHTASYGRVHREGA